MSILKLKFNCPAHRLLLLLCLALGGVPLFSQTATQNDDPRRVLLLSESEQQQFVRSYLNDGLPERLGDTFSLLLINRSALVVPILESQVELELQRPQRSERSIDLSSALVAYPGDAFSLEAVGKLLRLDESRFGPLVGRTLDNVPDDRNPFALVYTVISSGNGALSSRAIEWANSALLSNRMQRAWAELLLDRYGKVPSESEWANDPIASRLTNRASSELRQREARFVGDVQRKRQQR